MNSGADDGYHSARVHTVEAIQNDGDNFTWRMSRLATEFIVGVSSVKPFASYSCSAPTGGLCYPSNTAHYEFEVLFQFDTATVTEVFSYYANGGQQSHGNAATSDVWKLVKEGGQIKLYRGATLLRTWTQTPGAALYFYMEAGSTEDGNAAVDNDWPKIDGVTFTAGGGGGGTPTLTANAGPDQTVNVNTLVNLNGTGSTASGTSISSYAWSLTSGPSSPAITGANTATPSFTPTVPGIYILQLTVDDGSGGAVPSSDTVKIIVTSTAGGSGHPPSIGALGLTPSYPVEFEWRKKVLISLTDTGARQTVTKSKAFAFYPLNFKGRKESECASFQDGWDAAFPGYTFTWVKPHLNASGEWYFDSDVRVERVGHNETDYSVAVRSRDPFTRVVPASNVLPFMPSYGTGLDPTKHIDFSDALDFSRKAAALSAMKLPFRLVFKNRYLSEVITMIRFWEYYYPGRKISYPDPFNDLTAEFWIDSNFKGQFNGVNLVDYSFVIRGV